MFFKRSASSKNQSAISPVSRANRVSLEIDSGCIKVTRLRLKSNGQIVFDNADVAQLKYFSFDEVPHIIADFMKKNGIKKRHVISCFPRNLSTIRFMNLPSDNPKELREMVAFQAIKQIPYSKEDVIIDYEVISKTDDGYSTVMIVIVRKNIIYQHLDAIEGAGLITDRIDINSQAIVRTYTYLKNRETDSNSTATIPSSVPSGKSAAVALVDIDYTHTNLLVICDNKLLFTRGITLGIMHLLLKEKKFQVESANINWQSELMDELRRSFAVFSREHSQVFVEKIVLSGGVSNFHHIERNIRSRFQVPVEIFNITEKIPDLARFASNLTINDKEVSLMAAVGLLLPSNTRMIDMIPPEEKMRRKYRRRIATGIVASVLILGILICATVNFYTEITRKAEYINLLNSKISEISPQVQRLESMRLKINVIEQQVGKTRTSLEFLRELYRIIPPKINLSVFLYDESKYIIIKGTSTTMADVFDLIPKLENSPYFEKVSSRGVKRRKVGKKEVVDFEIQCPLIREEEHS